MPIPAYVDTDVAPGGAGTSGDPYSTLNEWDGADAGSISGQGECFTYWTGATANGTVTLSTDWTGESASDFVHVLGDSQSILRDQTTAWINVDPDTDTFGIRCDNDFFVFEGFQIAIGDSTTGTLSGIWINGTDGVMINVMIYANVSSRISTSGTVRGFEGAYKNSTYLINCTAVRLPCGFYSNTNGLGDGMIQYNCLAYDCAEGFDGNTGKELVINCIAQACTDGFNTCTNSSDTNNTSDIASDAPTTNGEQVTLSFTNPGYAAGDDYHLTSSDSTALGAGADLSSDAIYPFSTDGEGDSRSSWFRGPDEYTGASAALLVHLAGKGGLCGAGGLAGPHGGLGG